MEIWPASYTLARIACEERLREAEQHRRLTSSGTFKSLPALLRVLLLIFR